MEFILEQQAHWAAHASDSDARLARAEADLAKVDRHLAEITRHQAKTDKQIAIIALMVKAGMKRFAQQDKKIGALIEAQKRTDKKFDRLIDLLTKQSGNGRRR